MDWNQDASRKEDKMSIFTEESKKHSLGENAIIFLMRWVKDKNWVLSIIVDKIFWLSLRGEAACSFCFYYVNSEVAKVI